MKLGVGDVIVMPAGVSHEMVDCSEDISMVGGYPDGRDWDNIQEKFLTDGLFHQAAKRIMMLPVPQRDPVTGETLRQWLDAPSSVDGGLERFPRRARCYIRRGDKASCVDCNSITHRRGHPCDSDAAPGQDPFAYCGESDFCARCVSCGAGIESGDQGVR